MTAAAPIAELFRSVVAHAEGTPFHPQGDAEAFRDTVAATVLPRVLSLHAGDGTRLSVVVRNRRIIRLLDVVPADLWGGEESPETLPGDVAGDGFGPSFAKAVLAITAHADTRIETRLLDGSDLPGTLSGYPASRLVADLEDASAPRTADALRAFLNGWTGHARAWSGREDGIDVPDVHRIDDAWLRTRLADWMAGVPDDGLHLRHVMVGGDDPLAVAFVAMADEACVVACADAAQFARLDDDLAALHDRHGRV